MTSIYRWEGEVAEEQRAPAVIKTTRDQVAPLWERVRDLHPYDVPEFVVLPIIDGSDAYLRWIWRLDRAEPNPSACFEIVDQVLRVLDAGRDSHQAVGQARSPRAAPAAPRRASSRPGG